MTSEKDDAVLPRWMEKYFVVALISGATGIIGFGLSAFVANISEQGIQNTRLDVLERQQKDAAEEFKAVEQQERQDIISVLEGQRVVIRDVRAAHIKSKGGTVKPGDLNKPIK
jgi:hypothetical protein